MKTLDLVRSPYTSLAFNVAYALGNWIIGFLTHSWWFITVGAYYAVLTVTRYSVLQIRYRAFCTAHYGNFIGSTFFLHSGREYNVRS